MNAPKEVIDLAEQRIQARENKDFALSDQLRDKISDLGYVIKDNPAGYELVSQTSF
jgi:cysteinyl-tRNA synthetase